MNKIEEYFKARAAFEETENEILKLARSRLARIQALLKPLARGTPYCSAGSDHATVSGIYINISFTHSDGEITREGITFTEEINTACNCHPEYETFTQTLTIEDLTSSDEQFEKDIQAMYNAAKTRLDKLDKEAAAKKLAEEKDRELKKLESEKAKYEELKKKFEQ